MPKELITILLDKFNLVDAQARLKIQQAENPFPAALESIAKTLPDVWPAWFEWRKRRRKGLRWWNSP
jgi:hypothetical protein